MWVYKMVQVAPFVLTEEAHVEHKALCWNDPALAQHFGTDKFLGYLFQPIIKDVLKRKEGSTGRRREVSLC